MEEKKELKENFAIADVEIENTVKRIEDLRKSREELKKLQDELELRMKDLADAETVHGSLSKEYAVQVNHVDNVKSRIYETEKKISELSFKKSELKPVIELLTKKFENALKDETSREYHIELATREEDGKTVGDPSKAKKVYKQLLDYLNNDVKFTPKNAVNLMVLVRNMEDNKMWVNSKDFDGVIILRSASVLSLYRFILEELEGRGFYKARTFLECWANCGQAISDSVRIIQKENVESRKLGATLNEVEEEFEKSEDDLPKDSENVTTKEEVAPEVAE